MSQLTITIATMSSLEIVEVINEERKADAEAVGTRYVPLRHDNFLAKIEAHPGIMSPKFLGHIEIPGPNGGVRKSKCYHLPKREAELMVMSESLKVQTRVYDRLAALEGSRQDPLAALPPEHRALVALMCENAEIKARQAQIEAKQNEQADAIKRIEIKQSAFEDGHSFFTAVAFCALREIKLSLRDMQRLGRRAGSISRKKGIPIDKVRDARYGVVNSYHEESLAQALSEIHGGM
jgi:hypothetical protein